MPQAADSLSFTFEILCEFILAVVPRNVSIYPTIRLKALHTQARRATLQCQNIGYKKSPTQVLESIHIL